MINLTEDIFKKSNFIVEKLILNDDILTDDILLAIRNSKEFFDFYLIWYVEVDSLNLEFIKSRSEHILGSVLDKYDLPGINKNISLLILTESETLDNYIDEEFYKRLFDIEEDPFFFKKYVLYFTTHQKQLLNEKIRSGDILETLDKIIMDKKLFGTFKNNEEVEDRLLYDIVSKIYIKMPFMKLTIEKESMVNLGQKIENEIPHNDLDSINKILVFEENLIDLEKIEIILRDDNDGVQD